MPEFYDPQQGEQNRWLQTINDSANRFNATTDLDILGRGLNWDNSVAAYNAQYEKTMLGYQQENVGLQGQRIGVDQRLANQMYGVNLGRVGLGEQGARRDIGTEQALHGLRQQGFGLDEASLGLQGQRLGLQGKRLDLSEEAIGQAEREQRFTYDVNRREAIDRLAAQGAIASDYSMRTTNNLAQQLAFELERSRRERQGLGLDRSNLGLEHGQLGIDYSRVGLERQAETATHTNRIGGLNDALAGFGLERSALGFQNQAANQGFGLDRSGLGVQTRQIGTQYNAAEDRYQQEKISNALRQEAGTEAIRRRYAPVGQ